MCYSHLFCTVQEVETKDKDLVKVKMELKTLGLADFSKLTFRIFFQEHCQSVKQFVS